jgi:hypothetical protein
MTPVRLPLTRLIAALLLLPALARAGAGAEPLRAAIDREVKARWKDKGVAPAARGTDAEFLRRVYLDLLGTPPTYDEATKFLAGTSAKKREALVEALLADPRFAAAQANVWDLALFGRHPGNIGDTRVRPAFKKWLAKQFADGVAFDKLVKELLLAEQPGSEMFLVQFRNAPDEATVAVSRLFLGTQLQCAKCHDHPYDVWTQKDFYGMSGFFVRLVVQDSGSGNNRTFSIGEKNAGEVLFSGTAKDQAPGKKGEPVRPKFLGGEPLKEPPAPKAKGREPAPKAGQKLPKPAFSRKEELARWVTAPENPYFARAVVNRVWAQFMGRGLVHPIDDFNAQNEPSHPALLKALTGGFVAGKYDLKSLVREVVNSEAYQLGGAGESREALPKHFERARVRPLTAEEVMAAMGAATGSAGEKSPGVTTEYFLRAFGEPTNGQGEFQGSLGEHLFLNNSEQVRAFVRRKKGNLTDQLLTSTGPWEERVERMYLSVLSRPPKPKELEAFVSYIRREPKPDAAVEDCIWVLLNSSEFRFNH